MSELVQVSRGLWRFADDVDCLAARCAALLQVLPAGTVIGGLSAAALHGLWLPELPAQPVELIVPCAPVLPRDVAASRRPFRRRGVLKARAALPLLDARARSRPESHLRYALVGGGLPPPEVNAPIHSAHGEWLAEPDLHYPAARLALEYNGADHARPDRMRRDITRDLDYQVEGWRVITFGPTQVFRHPDQVASLVRSVLVERDPDAFRRRPSR